ncbi:MAG: FtsX-like permease family protein, partial [Planctomycetota bacterium]
GETVRLRVVGVLSGSIFQGDVLVSERALLRHFPETSGYRFFLVESDVESDPDAAQAIQEALDSALGDYGLTTETTGQRLGRFLVVQNTYLATFQSLGGLGLLLGTLGLAAVQLRAVLERRGELALLRATGFGRRALVWLVMLENGLLLLAGLGAGVAAALVAVLPHLASGGASIPWVSLGATLILVLAVGLLAGLAAVRAVLVAPLLAALRGE